MHRVAAILALSLLVLVGLNVARYLASPASVEAHSPASATERAGMGQTP